jgi:hypothetical protein
MEEGQIGEKIKKDFEWVSRPNEKRNTFYSRDDY